MEYSILRAFVNRPGVVYDALKTTVIFAEDMNKLKDNDAYLYNNQNAILNSSISLYRQAIINGNFDVWQRGTSFASIGSGSAYSADRWNYFRGGYVTQGTYSRVASGIDGVKYAMRIQRDSGTPSTQQLYIAQSLESVNSVPFQGKIVTLSFRARAGVNFSSISASLFVELFTGTGTDENINGITGALAPISSIATLTTTWQTFTYTGTISATANQLFVRLNNVPVGTAGANDYYEIAQVQLNLGSVAFPFQPKFYAEELINCQRYYQRFNSDSAYATMLPALNTPSSIQSSGARSLLVSMRIPPIAMDNSVPSTFDLSDGVTTFRCTSITYANIQSTKDIVFMNFIVASGLTVFRNYRAEANNTANAYIGFTAEL